MEAQEIFDTVVNHLRTQNTRAVTMIDGEEQCQYRAVDEAGCVTKCAAGCLIPDEDYTTEFEGKSVCQGTTVGEYFLRKYDNLRAIHLLRDLQRIHDDKQYFAMKEASFQNIAQDYGLTYTAPAV